MANFNPAPGFKDALMNGGGVDDINRLTLHYDLPGDNGANEVGSPSYTPQTPQWGTSSGGVASLARTVAWRVGAITVRFIGGYHNNTFRGYWTPDDEVTFESPGYYVAVEGSLSI